MTTSERDSYRGSVRAFSVTALFNCTYTLMTGNVVVTRKTLTLPHREVKIGHLARETAKEEEEEEKNEKEGKIGAQCLLVGAFFCRPEIRNFTL